MPSSPEPGRYLDRALLLFALGLFLFAAPPLTTWWSMPGRAWYLPYLLWLAVILLGLWLQRRRDAP